MKVLVLAAFQYIIRKTKNPGVLEDAKLPEIVIEATAAAKFEASETSFSPSDMTAELMSEIKDSFAEPIVSLAKDSSRSGSKLFLTRDKKFFLKTIGNSEYDTLWKWVNYADDENQTLANVYRSKHCTSLVGLGQSRCKDSLLAPFYVAFKHTVYFKWNFTDADEEEDSVGWNFLLMSAAFTREEQYLRSMYPDSNTNYMGDTFDLKPLPSRSEIDELAPRVKSLNLSFDDFTGIHDLRLILANDIDGLNERNMIDYSILVWSAQFEAKSEPALELPGCIQSCKPEGEEGVSCVMLCFSLIDYLVEFSFVRHLEDKYKYIHGRGDKFKQYGLKTKDMMHCLGNLPVYGLQYLECLRYLHKACAGIGEEDVVCAQNAKQMEILGQGVAGDLYDDVKGAAGTFAGALGSILTWSVKLGTSPVWLPVFALKKFGGAVAGAVNWLFDSRTEEEIEEDLERETRREQLEFLREQMEMKLESENEKAAFQFWCQKRIWRSFNDEDCVKEDGLRWRHDFGRWEATWNNEAGRFLYGFKVELPTKREAFEDDGTIRKGWNDFDTALEKAAACLDIKDANACMADGGIAA